MKKIYKVSIIIFVAIVVVVSSIFFLKKEKTEPIFNDDIKHDLAVADFQEGEEYQFKGIPWGISQEELEEMVPFSLFQFDYQIGEAIDLHSTEPYLFFGKTTDAIFRFTEDKLTEVQLTFRRDENAVEQYESIVEEATELFGLGRENIEGHFWKTDNTMLDIKVYNVSGRKVMNIFISSLNESDLDGEGLDNEEASNKEALNETENIKNTEDLVEFKLSDLKSGGEYLIDLIPLGTSWYELRPWAALDGYQQITLDENTEYDISDVRKYVYVSNESLLGGKRFNAICEFLHDELVDIKLVFRNEENIAEQFDPFVAELTELFGAENDRTEDSNTGSIAYTWQTDNTRLRINLEVLDDATKDMTLSIGYTEKELDRIAAENIKEFRELPLAYFKQDQGYQFGEVAWKSSVEEVEALLNGNLKNVTLEAPKDYIFYDFKDIVYVLDGYEAKASFEFQSGELVYVDFGFYDLEDPKAFFEEIVSVFQNEYGTETDMNQNEAGNISYRWRTENSQLAVGFNENYNEQVTIFLIPLK